MKRSRLFIVYIAVFAAVLLSLYLLLALCATVPGPAIRNNMRISAKYFVNSAPYTSTEDGKFQNIADNYADQIWNNIAWHLGSGDPFLSTLDTGYYDSEEYDTSTGLHMSVNLGMEANVDYTRYWHGTAGLIRLLHLFTDIRGVRTMGMACLLLAVFFTLRELWGTGHWDLALCVLAALLGVQFWNLRLSVEYQPCFLICFALCPYFLRFEKRGDIWLNVLAIISGTMTAFFDFLTTETLTILFPLILVIAIRSRERRLHSPRKTLRMLAACCLCWGLAYAGTFAVKWVAVSLATGENHIGQALLFAGKRVNGAVSAEQISRTPGLPAAIGANLSALFEGSSRIDLRRILGGLVVCVLLAAAVMRMYRVRQKLYPGTGFLLLLGAVVFLRYSVLLNHSYLHAFFTYRAMASTVLAILAAMVINLRPAKKGGPRTEWN